METGEREHWYRLGAFMDQVGRSRLGLLFDIIPSITWYANNPDEIPERFRSTIQKILQMWDTAKLTNEYDIDFSLLVDYAMNAERRWRKNIDQISLGEAPNTDTHEGIDHSAYLEMLNARHLAAIPWITSSFQEGQYKSAVDLGGGAGTALRLLKDQKIIEKAFLVDTPGMVDEFERSRFAPNADETFVGDITTYSTWLELLQKTVEKPSLWIISDVLHGRSLSDRGEIYRNISDMLATSLLVKEELKYTLPDIYIREFSGFSPIDTLLFDIQLKLFTQGQLLTKEELSAELGMCNLHLELCHNTEFYYYGKVIRKELVDV